MYEIDPFAIRKARRAQRMSLSEAARQLGRNCSTIWRYEHGKLIPSATTLFAMAEMYNVVVEAFLRLDDRGFQR